MKAILYKGQYYIRCIPAKSLFNSSLVHQVVNRGDVFALNIATQELTILQGKEAVSFIDIEIMHDGADLIKARQADRADTLRKYREQLKLDLETIK